MSDQCLSSSVQTGSQPVLRTACLAQTDVLLPTPSTKAYLHSTTFDPTLHVLSYSIAGFFPPSGRLPAPVFDQHKVYSLIPCPLWLDCTVHYKAVRFICT